MKTILSILIFLVFLTSQSCSDSNFIVTEKNTYDFLNAAIFNKDSLITDKKEFQKVNISTIPFSESVKSYIWQLNIEISDKLLLERQVEQEPISFDCSKLQNVVCISNDTIENIFKIGSDIIKTDTGIFFIDAWEDFRKKYGNGGIHSYSRPIFNKKKDLVIIEHSGQGDWTLGSGSFLLFKKIDKRWVFVSQKELWISEVIREKHLTKPKLIQGSVERI